MPTAKIIIVGPCRSGKTYFSNFLASSTTPSSGEYYPTKGVRILEFSTTANLPHTGRLLDCEVELWDSSGDRAYEACWPAIASGAHGLLVVYSVEQFEAEEVESFYRTFSEKIGLKEYQCLLVGNRRSGAQGRAIMTSFLSKVKHMQASIELDPDSVRTDFNEFLSHILSGIKSVQDKEELGIVGNTQ